MKKPTVPVVVVAPRVRARRIQPERMQEVAGGGDIQARAFGAGKYGVELD